MNEPAVSIIIPHYDRTGLLRETVDSIRNQGITNFECLIIDDGSGPEALRALREIIGEDRRFILLQRDREPKGAPVCRNIGIREARGEYLMFLDSDDLMAPWCLEQRLNLFADHPSHDLIVCQTALFRHENYLADRLHSSLVAEDDLQAFIRMHGWGTSSPFYRTGFVKTLRFDEQARSWQDIEFHMRLLLKKPDYRKFPDSRPDVFKRFGGGQQVSATNIGFDRLSSLLYLFLNLEKDFDAAGVSYRQEFLKYYFKFLEIGARVGTYSDFKKLMNLWNESTTSNHPKAKLFRAYLSAQALLTKFGLYKLGSIPYRMIRYAFPNHLLDFTAKHVPLDQPVDLKKLMSDEDKIS